MSTLVEELEQAAREVTEYADYHEAARDELLAFADRLRQRAAWVRELEAKATKADCLGCCACDDLRTIRALTGPIPAAETATTERKEP